MSSKRKEYQVDRCAAKVSKFFLVCESHIDPDMRVKIPAAMMAKGYSDQESKNRILQMQVFQEVEKNRGLDPPHPPKAVAVATMALLTLAAPPKATRVTLQRRRGMVCPRPRRRLQREMDNGVCGERRQKCSVVQLTTRRGVGAMRGTARWVDGGKTPRGHFPWRRGNGISPAVAIM
jgi:hypothetical protein